LRIAENIGYLSFEESDVAALSATHAGLLEVTGKVVRISSPRRLDRRALALTVIVVLRLGI